MAAVMEEKPLLGIRELALLVCSVGALFMLIALITFSNEDAGWSHSGPIQTISNACGLIGAWLSDFILSLFGLMGYSFPLMLAWIGYLIYRDNFYPTGFSTVVTRNIGFIFTIAFGTALLYLHMPRVVVELPGGTGGVLGQELGDLTYHIFGNSGATLILLVGTLVGVTLFTDFSWLGLMDFIGKYTLLIFRIFWQPLDVMAEFLARFQPDPTTLRTKPQTEAPQEGRHSNRTSGNNSQKVKIAPVIGAVNADREQRVQHELKPNIVRNTEPRFGERPSVADMRDNNNRISPEMPKPVVTRFEEQLRSTDQSLGINTRPSNDEFDAPQAAHFAQEVASFKPEPLKFVAHDDLSHEDLSRDDEDDNALLMMPDYPELVDDEPEVDEYEDYEATLNHQKIHAPSYQPAVEQHHASEVVAHTAVMTRAPLILEPKLKITDYQNQSRANSSHRSYLPSENVLPDLSLLDERDTRVNGYSDADLEEMSRLVEEVLQDFNVLVEVVAVHPGPVITRFELQPAAGVKVSRISSLAKDLARALSVTSVRIVEIIPGKSVIGLEIPNQEREMVTLRELLVSPVFNNAKSILTLAMGKDIGGEPVVADLAKMPHALVAGTTGSGKSVAINTMILSLLYKATPEQVRLIMIDPKMLELSVYEGIPHLLTPVVTDMKEAQNALRWAVGEMERRYKLMSKMGVRNLAGFNVLIEEAAARGEAIRDPMYQYDKPLGLDEDLPVLSKLPSIVIVIDELADMMMIVGKKVEELIARLAQKARAAGIHLILATQRPSVDVLTGLIKANVPTRISFQVSSRIDSRTILDQGGAEALLGNGDMLFLPSGTSIPIRAHGAFVDDHEVHRVVEFLKQTAPPNYLDEILRENSEANESNGAYGGDDSEADALYDQAVMFVTETRKASISSVQRKFKIGYNRAARMIEDMEVQGVVSQPESNGYREVLAPAPPRID